MSLQGTMNWKVVGEKRAIQIGDVIGKGGQSTVYKGVFDQKLVAVKIIANEGDDKEVKILRKLDHPNIIKIFFTDISHPMTFMALELCNHTLKEYVENSNHGIDLKSLKVLKEITEGLHYLHNGQKFCTVHRDLKPTNILFQYVDREELWRVKISDLGISKEFYGDKTSTISRLRGTSGYIAPELLRNIKGKIRKETDMFSLGVIIYYTLSNGKHPFSNDPFECELKIRDCEPCLDELESEYTGIVESLILSLLRKIYQERPSVSEVKSHHIFWGGEKKLDFLQKASDYMENRVIQKALIKKLEVSRQDVTCGKNWKDVICSETHNQEIKRVLEKDRHCQSKTSLQDLLRKIRNWASHYFDEQTTVQFRTELGDYPNGFVNFFTSHFPKLLPCVYEIMMTQKNEDIFKLFYVTEIDSPKELSYERKEEALPGATGVSSPIDADPKYAEESDDTDYEDFLPSSTPQEQLYTSIKLPKTNVTLQVWKTNIVQHKCDVIVNASNPKFKLLDGGVSGEIRKFDLRNRNVIQDEMSRLVRENHGDFFAGYAAITTAGNLPACKKIVHAVGPRWNISTGATDPNLVLRACTFKCLQETEQAGMTSIAIPALSCGIFGGKVKICIPLILQAVVEYFENKRCSKITTVDFVALGNQEVLDEFKKCLENHEYVAQTPKPTAAPSLFFPQNFGLSVKLGQGDISTQKGSRAGYCLKATGVLDGVSSAAIRLLFESVKRVSGGPVTRVDRYQNNTALIYFTSSTVAARIYRRFKKPCVESLILHQHLIEIELYFHSLANLHKNAGKVNSTASNDMDEGKDLSPTVPCPKRPLRFFSMEPKIHKNIFFFIRGNKKFVEKLKNNFSELAKVELNHSKHGIKIKFSPEKDRGLDTQDGFNVECKKRFEDFSAAFTTCSRTFDDTKLKNARSLKIHSVLDRKRKTENNDFSIRWNADKPIVDVTGLKDGVDKTIKNIEALINSVFVDMEVTEEQYRIMVCCGIIEELQKKFQNVDIKCDTDKNSITLSGPDSDVSKLQITAFQQLTKDFQKRKLTGIDASVVRYLSESMNVSKMTTTIHEKFTDNNVKGTLEWDEKEARLVVRSEDDFKKAEKVITDLINVRSIPTDKNFSDVVKSKEWNGFQQNLKKNGMCELYIKTNQCIVLVSFASELLSLEQKVKDFLDENSGEKKFFEVSYGVARYIVETSKEFSSGSCEKKKIKCGLTATNRKRIFIEGKKKDCLNAGANMAHLIQNVKERKYTLHDPGIKEYYESSEGKEFLESNERLNNCIILASTHQFCNRIQQPQPSQFQSQSQNLTSGLSVKLVQGDILKQTADVIVNVTNTQGIQGSAISRALVKIAGVGVQTEFSLLPQPIKVGNVYETNAGNLSCKKIYHSIVTEYDPLNSEAIIQLIVKRCLHTADKAGFRSISFPAIATGGFNHPPASVALWMRNEISRFKSNSLKDVIIVLYPSNHATISAFDAEFNNPSSHGSTSPSSSMNYGPLNISVYQGDITREHSDAIVNSAGSNFDLSQAGALSQAILSKGGNTIQVEVFNSSGSNFRKSSGGNLPCRVIIHIATSNNEKDITKKLLIALEEADRTGITSISIPALATGGHALKSASVAQAMKEAFDDFAKTQVSNLKTINVVVFDLAQLNDFKVGILSNQQTVFSKIKEKQSAIFQKFISSSANVTFDLYFYSTDSGAIDKAIDNVTKETKKVVSSQPIKNDAFDRLTDLEMWNIMQICKDNKVSIADKSTKSYKQFACEGLTHDVIKAHEAVNNVLTEFCAAETSALYVTWQTLRNGNWDDCPIQANHILEEAFKARNGNNTNPTLNHIQIPEYNFSDAKIGKTTIDLSNLEANQHGLNPPSVRRKVKEKGADNVIPSTWEDMKGDRFRKIKLSSTTQEYTSVENKFIKAGGRQTILMIERIQNPDIYKLYITKKAEVTNKKLTSGNPVKRELFHGTSDEDGEKILLHGFDMSYAGKNATALGKGVYFATTASYSNTYAFADSNGQKRMFLANVVTGDYCLGNSAYVAPPQRPGTVKNDLYDSVVNNEASPTIFVIFKDASAYPTYLITYT